MRSVVNAKSQRNKAEELDPKHGLPVVRANPRELWVLDLEEKCRVC